MKNFTYLIMKKSLLYGILFLSSTTNILGQDWLKQYESITLFDVIEAENGDLLLSGSGNDSIRIIRVDIEGNEVWQLSIDERLDLSGSQEFSWWPEFTKSSNNHFTLFYTARGWNGQDTISGMRIKKINDVGNVVFETICFECVSSSWPTNLIETSDEGFIYLRYDLVVKLDALGNVEWTKSIDWMKLNFVVQTENGDFILLGGDYYNSHNDMYWMGIDSNGVSLWVKTLPDNAIPGDLIKNEAGGFTILALSNYNHIGDIFADYDSYQPKIIEINEAGEILNQYFINTIGHESTLLFSQHRKQHLHQKSGEKYELLINNYTSSDIPIWSAHILETNSTGEITDTLNIATHDISSSGLGYTNSFNPHSAGGYIIVGYTNAETISFITRVNSFEQFSTKIIHGKLFKNDNPSCNYDETEIGLPNWIVSIENIATAETLYATTDSEGNYSVNVNEGTYQVTAQIPSAVWEPCQDPIPTNPQIVTLDETLDTAIVNFPINPVLDCPIMTVNISAPLLRRCYDNTYYVQYCNEGTETAINAHMEVTLDEYFDLDSISASIPYIVQGEVLLFPVGDVAIDECGQFSIQAYLDCNTTVTGQTHCTEARVFPEPWCLPINENWDGSSITVEGECETDVVRFYIRNEGTGDMEDSLNYYIVIDELIMLQGKFKLDSDGVKEVEVAAESQTYRLDAEQAPFHPGSSIPNAVIEGCPDFGSLGYVTLFPQNDEDPNIDIDCQENISSFDPNDKQAFPVGYETLHQIEPETDLEYHIRFQNTGTDTAFRVVVRDTFSQHLDLSTFQMDVASHPYEWEIFGVGVLKVTFENIMLPDSNVNEAASHGFFKYSISPKADLSLGTILENRAGIYFDFNAPILTNTVFHTIDKGFVEVVSVQNLSYKIYPIEVFPNPFADATTFQLPESFKELELEVFDMVGRKVITKHGSGAELNLKRQHLERGIYFFNLYGDGHLLGLGKLILE